MSKEQINEMKRFMQVAEGNIAEAKVDPKLKKAAKLMMDVADGLDREYEDLANASADRPGELESEENVDGDAEDYKKLVRLLVNGRGKQAVKFYDSLDTAAREFIYDYLEEDEIQYMQKVFGELGSEWLFVDEYYEESVGEEHEEDETCLYCGGPHHADDCREYDGLDGLDEEATCKCGRKGCQCGPECDCEPVEEGYGAPDHYRDFSQDKRTPEEIKAANERLRKLFKNRKKVKPPMREGTDKPHKYTYVYTDKQGNKTYIGVWYTEGNAVPKIRLWNEDRLPYAITNVMFMRDGSDQYLTDLFKEEVFNAFFDEETDEPRVADTQDVLDAVRDATRLGKAIMPVQNEAVDEDRDVDGMGHYNVIYHDDEIETALPYDQAIAKAKEFIEGVWLGKPPKVKKISKGDSVVFAWVDGNERDQVTIEPTDDADVDAWYGESISLSNIVKDLLNEGPELGKSQLIKDYADENDFDYTDLAMQDEEPGADEPEYPEADNQELSPRNVAWPKGVSIVDADDELEEDADDMDADNDGVIDDENIELDDLSINVDLEDF